jgi:SAM-dependent methyltransferase
MAYSRYAYAAQLCGERDVLEIGCGAGLGLGYLSRRARTVVAGDFTANLLRVAKHQYGSNIPLVRFDAHLLPFREASFDVTILFEAIYYLADPFRVFDECRRVLKENGLLLICTVNRTWRDFNPSPLSTRYLDAGELGHALACRGFDTDLLGAFSAAPSSPRAAVIGLLKRCAVAAGLIPKTMVGKQALKRIFLGPLIGMPATLDDGLVPYEMPRPVVPGDTGQFKVIFAVAKRRRHS